MDSVLIDVTEWPYEALNKALSFCSAGHQLLRSPGVTYGILPTGKKLTMLTPNRGLCEGQF
jgi:hypothetical protein